MTPQIKWAAGLAALAIAAGLGFGLARMTGGAPAPAAAPEAAAKPTPGTLAIPAAYLTSAGITTESVAAGDLASEIKAPANVHAQPAGEAIVTARAAGTLVRLTKRIGDAVRAGETVALVESRDAAAMTADRAAAQAKADLAAKILARERSLYDQRVSPRQDLEAAEAGLAAARAEARRAQSAAALARVSPDGRTLAVVSPIAGRISAEGALLGSYVQPETQVFRVADPMLVQIEAAVPAADAARIRTGDPAVLVAATGVRIDARVSAVTPSVDPETRAATVVIEPLGAVAAFAPGDIAQALIKPRSAAPTGLIVPEEAIQRIDGREAVFVRTPTGFRVAPVLVGRRSGGRAVILSGLTAGQAVAARNAFLLKAELGKGQEEEE